MILVSACLLGINCKYDGDNNKHEKVIQYLKNKQFILVCPEQLGGLPTPRVPSEIDNKVSNENSFNSYIVKDKNGLNVSENFSKGAYETLKIAKLYGCKEAILKEGSPSCGSNKIYDGSFNGNKIDGMGITARTLKKEGIKIISEKQLEL
ncbi:MAG: DUF523 domain-containing protein [Peptostreptococcaceae bacterium]